MTDTAARKISVGQIVMGKDGYRIPEYQRNYAWTASEITQLIADVDLARAGDQPTYFLGNIVTTRTANNEHDVVDGQQRLTTLVLLISYLRIALDRATDDRLVVAYPLTFASRHMATAAIKRLTTATSQESALDALEADLSEGEDGVVAGRRGAVQGLRNGYLAIRTALEEKLSGDVDGMSSFLDYLLTSVEMIRVVLPHGTDLNRYFEVMNTRGVQLEPTDIVRAKLMSALSTDESQMRTFRRIWDACAQMEGYVQITLARGDRPLREALFGPNWEWVRPTNFDQLNDLLGAENIRSESTPTGSRVLSEALTDYLRMSPRPDAEEEDQTNRQYRPTIRFPFLLLHALSLFEKQRGTGFAPDRGATVDSDNFAEDPALNDKRLIMRFDEAFARTSDAPSTTPDPEKVRLFALHLLRVRNLFDAYIVRRHQPGPATSDDDGTWVLKSCRRHRTSGKFTATYRDTFGPRDGDEDSDEHSAQSGPRSPQRDLVLLESMLRVTYTSPRSMRWITDVLEQALHHHFPDSAHSAGATPEVSAVLMADDLRRFLRELPRERIRNMFLHEATRSPELADSELLGTSRTGFDIPRIVYTYLDYLMLDQALPDVTGTGLSFRPVSSRDFIFRFRNSVEHFAPRTRDEETDRTVVNETWMDSLGNLALITVRQNSKFSNASPIAKSESSETVLQQSPKLWRMTRLALAEGSWGNAQIGAHHRECTELLYQDLYENKKGS